MAPDTDLLAELTMTKEEAMALYLLCFRISDEAVADIVGEDLARAGASAVRRVMDVTRDYAPYRPPIPRVRLPTPGNA